MTKRSERHEAAQHLANLVNAVNALADAGAPLSQVLTLVQDTYDARQQALDEQLWHELRRSGMRDYHCERCGCGYLHRTDGTCPTCGAPGTPVS